MAIACGCDIKQKNGTVCPSQGFTEKLEDAARKLVVAVDHGSGVNIAMKNIQEVFGEMGNARHAWNKR